MSYIKRVDVFKRLFLYFEGGTYADFDTVINEDCFANVKTDMVIFSNVWSIDRGIKIP